MLCSMVKRHNRVITHVQIEACSLGRWESRGGESKEPRAEGDQKICRSKGCVTPSNFSATGTSGCQKPVPGHGMGAIRIGITSLVDKEIDRFEDC